MIKLQERMPRKENRKERKEGGTERERKVGRERGLCVCVCVCVCEMECIEVGVPF